MVGAWPRVREEASSERKWSPWQSKLAAQSRGALPALLFPGLCELTFMSHSICATYLGSTIPQEEETKVILEALISIGEFQNCSNEEL